MYMFAKNRVTASIRRITFYEKLNISKASFLIFVIKRYMTLQFVSYFNNTLLTWSFYVQLDNKSYNRILTQFDLVSGAPLSKFRLDEKITISIKRFLCRPEIDIFLFLFLVHITYNQANEIQRPWIKYRRQLV